jgi:two-component system response regulator FixJ
LREGARPADHRLVHIVDDNELVRRSTSTFLGGQGFHVQTWCDGDSFLKAASTLTPSCLILDLVMPGLDGLEVQGQMRQRGMDWPIIFFSGKAKIPDAVQAVLNGAVQFLVKPVRPVALRQALDQAFERLGQGATDSGESCAARMKLLRLTPREHDVLDGLVEGLPNKAIAYDLGVSPRTIEAHRSSIMRKLEAANLAQLLRTALVARGQPL